MQERLRRVRHAAAASLVIFAAALLWSSVRPEFSPPSAFELDKLAHTGAFAVMAFLASLAFPYRRSLVAALVALVLFGGIIELAQLSTPGRTASLADWLVDLVGLGIGVAIGCMPSFRRLFGAAPS